MTILGPEGELIYDRDLCLNDHLQRYGATDHGKVISLLGADPRVEIQFHFSLGFSITRPSGEDLSLETAVSIANKGQDLPDGTLDRVRSAMREFSMVFSDSQPLDGLSTSVGLDDVGRPEWREEL